MTPELIRSIWKAIELIPPQNLSGQDNDAVVDIIIASLSKNVSFNSDQILPVRAYLRSRIVLIHELAEDKQLSNPAYLAA